MYINSEKRRALPALGQDDSFPAERTLGSKGDPGVSMAREHSEIQTKGCPTTDAWEKNENKQNVQKPGSKTRSVSRQGQSRGIVTSNTDWLTTDQKEQPPTPTRTGELSSLKYA